MAGGRPEIYTDELADDICKQMANGKSLVKVCKGKGMPSRATVYVWLKENKEFSDNYIRAREEQADYYADQIIEIADEPIKTNEQANHAKIRIDARKWKAARMKPKSYGDSRQIEVSGPDGGPVNMIGQLFQSIDGKTKTIDSDTEKG